MTEPADFKSAGELLAAFEEGAFINPNTIRCPCGVVRSMTAAFHKRTMNHDCVYHARNSCGSCRIVDRTLVQVEARLRAEVEHGPFVTTRWEAA